MAVLVLTKPGPPLPLAKGAAIAAVLAALVSVGVLMVPLLENYALAGVLLTGVILYGLFFAGIRTGNPLTMVLVIAFTMIPVAGVAEQALVTAIAVTLAAGFAARQPGRQRLARLLPRSAAAGRKEGAARHRPRDGELDRAARHAGGAAALRAGADRPVVLPGDDHEERPARPAGGFDRHAQGRRGTGGVDAGRGRHRAGRLGRPVAVGQPVDAGAVDAGAALWVGARLYRVVPTAFPPAFWNNALVTTLILIGPAIEDSANGSAVLQASAVRVALFVGVSLYAWAMVWLLERWRAARRQALFFDHG
jgi:hypothetical protein